MSKANINQQEIVIDIHLKNLKLVVQDKTPLRVVWSRGKKQAKSQVKFLNEGLSVAVFDEKFQINTVLDINEDTGKPAKPKMSKMTVQLDKSKGGTPIGEVEFDMTDFTYGEYNYRKLELISHPDNNGVIEFAAGEAYLEIGLKGTKQDGLVQKRMSEIKQQMDSSIKDILKSSMTTKPKTEGDQIINQTVQSEELFKNIVQIEVDKLKRDAKEKMKEYEDKLQKKNKIINDLLTESENIKTEKLTLQTNLTDHQQREAKLQSELETVRKSL